jgi:hypothetical protein
MNYKNNTITSFCEELIEQIQSGASLSDVIQLLIEWQQPLEHHKDNTCGLYAFDCNPKELLNKFNNSQSDAHNIECVQFEQLIIDWERFCDDKNFIGSPFFRIKF